MPELPAGKIICAGCGRELKEGHAFCQYCGTAVKKDKTEESDADKNRKENDMTE